MPYLNKPKIASSYGDWRCGSCGFTNSLDVLDCTNCQKLKKSSEENFSLKDENVTRSNSEKMMNTCPLGENAVCPVTVGDNHRSADNCMKGNQYSHNVECDYKAIPKSSLKLKLPFNIKSSKKKSLELLSHRGVLVPAQEIDDTSGPILASKNFEALNVSLDTEFEMFRKENEEGFCSVKTNLHEEVASLTPSNIYETEKRHLVESVAQETFSQYGSLDSRRICRYVSEHICSAPCEDMNTTTTEHKVLHAGTVAVKNKECSGTYSEDSINLSFVSASESVGTVDKQIVELNDASVNTEHKLQDSDFPTACLSMNSSDEVNDVYQIMIETASLNTVSEKAMGTKERGGCAVKFCSHDLQSEFADGTQCIASEEKKDAPWCQAEGSSNSSSTAFLFKTVSNTKWKMLLEDSRILSPEVLEIAADAELKDSFVTVDENFDTDRVMVQRKGEKSCKGNDIAKQDKLCLKLIEDSSASDDCHDIRTKLIVMHRKCTSCLDKKPGISKSVDVSADFKNCLKVSRSTMTKPDTTSRADNTDLSMMNSTKPGRSKNGSYRNSACNTEKWPFCQSTVVDQGSQTVYSEMKNKCIGTDKQTLEWNAVVKVSQKCENNKESIKKGETRCSNDGNKDDQSSTYQALKQRAVKAELQLLELQYFMCVQHCLRLHQLVLEEKECFTTQGVLSECASAVEHSSSMSLILQDLRNKYLKMKDALLSGCALDSFPPFSVELKGNLGFTTYVPLQERRTTEQFITGSASTRTRDLSHQSRACNEGKNTFEIIQDGAVIGHDTTEDWFDAEENIDPNKSSRFQGQRSGGCSDRDKEVRKLGTIPKTGTKTDQEANEKWFDADEGHKCEGCSAGDVQIQNMKTIHDPEVNFSGVTEDKPKELHHVFLGGLPVGVSEEDLRFHFKKFPFSELYISDGSLKTRYAVLAFKTARDAERTTLEMSGSEIQGQAIKAVRIVPSEECSSCFSSFPSSTPVMISGSKDVQKNCKRMQKLCNMPTASGTFVPQNSANLSSFTKVVKRLTEMHSHSSRNEIFEALSEVRSKNNGSLNGLPISTIIERASSLLKKEITKKETD